MQPTEQYELDKAGFPDDLPPIALVYDKDDIEGELDEPVATQNEETYVDGEEEL